MPQIDHNNVVDGNSFKSANPIILQMEVVGSRRKSLIPHADNVVPTIPLYRSVPDLEVRLEDFELLKQKQRERMQPKMGKMDIDYQVLHDAFFKHQTKPKLTYYGITRERNLRSNPSIIRGFSGLCAFMGVAATFVSAKMVKQLGVLKAGAVALSFKLHFLPLHYCVLEWFFISEDSICSFLGITFFNFKKYVCFFC